MRDQPELPVLSSAALRALREDQPSSSELDSAYRRFARRQQPRASRLLVSRWAIAGLVMGLGVAFAADAVVQQRRAPVPARVPASVSVPPSPRKAAAPPGRPDTPEPAAELPTAAVAENPRVPSSTTPKAFAPVGSIERTPADSALWTKAAAGLRNDDFAETQSALSTLEHAGSAADREAARLIRAQLMLHRGDSSGARALLQDLSANAQSAQVRAKARSLLAQTSGTSNSALDPAPSGT